MPINPGFADFFHDNVHQLFPVKIKHIAIDDDGRAGPRRASARTAQVVRRRGPGARAAAAVGAAQRARAARTGGGRSSDTCHR